MWPLILQSLVASAAVRKPIRDAATRYVFGPKHKRLDPYILPLIKAWDTADRTLFKPLDYADSYMGRLENGGGPLPPRR
jgi:hypothetical protein